MMDTDCIKPVIEKLSVESLPIFSHTARLISTLSDEDNANINELTSSILTDPALTSRILNLANSSMYARGNSKICTISRAIFYLGFSAIRTMALSAAFIDSIKNSRRRDRIISQVAQSFHAAVQAKGLAENRGESNTEEIFISTLLSRLGPIAFWSSDSVLTDKLEKALSGNPHEPAEVVERQTLGFNLIDLTVHLATEWKLGELLTQAITGKNRSSRSSALILGYSIANSYATSYELSERLMKNICKYLKCSPEEANKILKSNIDEAVDTSRIYGICNYLDSIKVLGSKKDVEVHKENESEQVDSEFNNRSVEFNSSCIFTQLDMLSEINSIIKESKFNLNLLLSTTIEGVYRGIGMDRVLFCVLGSDRRSISGKYGLGWSQNIIEHIEFMLHDYQVDKDIVNYVFRTKSTCFVNGSRNKYSRYLSNEIKVRLGTETFFLSPVLIKKSVIGLIFADRSISQRDLTEMDLVSFQFTMAAANAALSMI